MNTYKKLSVLAFTAAIVLNCGCSVSAQNSSTTGMKETGTGRKVYNNPVIRESVPDPTAMRISDGTYYLYGTENIRNMPIYKSDDMVNWTFVGTAFTDETRPVFQPEVSTKRASLWAPEIRFIKGKYVLFYSLARWGEEWLSSVGYALSDSPEGPFLPKGYVLNSRQVDVQNSIDQFIWEENGKYYILWGSFHGIYIMELDITDDVTITPKIETKQQLAGDAYEGINLWKRDGFYYLFASRGTCCEGIRSTYTTVAGRSESLFGPYVDKDGKKMLDNEDELLLRGTEDTTFRGTGHNSILLTDDAQQTWMLYHAYYKPRADGDDGRSACLDRVDWVDGWPVIGNGMPSTEAEVPVVKTGK